MTSYLFNFFSALGMIFGIMLIIAGVLDRYSLRATNYAFFVGWCTGLAVSNLFILLVQS